MPSVDGFWLLFILACHGNVCTPSTEKFANEYQCKKAGGYVVADGAERLADMTVRCHFVEYDAPAKAK